MGALMRAVDWSKTPVGAVETWPQSLKTSLSILLESKFGTMVAWGPELTHFYNDAYRPILGSSKHPSLGRRVPEVFPEIWQTIGPLFDGVMQGTAVGFDDLLVPLDRHGYLEEIYFTFSYTPIRDEAGAVGGILVTVAETTMRLIQERRLRTLRDLALRAAQATAEAQAWLGSAEILTSNDADVPFALLYALDPDGQQVTLAASTAEVAASLRPAQVRVDRPADQGWPIGSVLASNEARLITDVEARFGAQRGRKWPEPIRRALLLPIRRSEATDAYGVLVLGLSPRRDLDDDYRDFCGLIADQIAAAVANCRARAEDRKRAEALAEIDRAKTAFFSNVSHEFRTPLTLMLGPLQQALESPQATLGGQDLEAVHRNSLRLLKLVNALLDFARAEAGRAQAYYRPTDLAELTRDVASAFQSAIERGGLSFEIDCPPLSAPVSVDRDMWEKIVLNLLSNAFKFTLGGKIRLALEEVGQVGRMEKQVRLTVSDTGVGIPASEVPHVFERFRTVSGAHGRTQEGSGIGLALVHELVQLHRGRVTVESRLGEGTAFTVSLPAEGVPARDLPDAPLDHAGATTAEAYVVEALRWLASPTAADGPAAEARGRNDSPAPTPTARPAHILLADDNADMREYMTRLLAHRWTVRAVADGAQALAAIRQRRPDLVLTDVMMPNIGGFELLRALRADPQTADIPVIMLSARAGEESRIEGLQAGADDYLTKPFSAKELAARVTTHLELGRLRRQAELEREKLHAQFMQAPVPMSLVIGPELVFELANRPYLEMIGRSDVIGKSMKEVFAELPPDAPVFGLLREVYQSGRAFTTDEYRVPLDRNGDGKVEDAFFRFTCQPMTDATGAVEGLMTVAVDITPQVAARAQAELASRAKDEFLAVLGHELRNPLAPMMTALRLLQMKGFRADELAIMERQVGALVRLVDDLMDVSRITRGKIELRRSRIELSTVVLQGLETASPLLDQRRHRVDLKVPVEGLPVEGDPDRLSQVISNLLTNAAKYSDPGSEIHVVAERVAGRARLRIRDHGIGIPPEMLTRIFEMFVQEPQALDRAKGGIGLGLAIVRSLVDLHRGKVWATSQGPGTGSELIVELPLAPGLGVADHGTPLRRVAGTAEGSAKRPARVLIVDDNEDAALMLAEFLVELGHEVRTAHDGPSAIEVAGGFRPTICLVDIGLPVMDGYEVARRLRQLEQLPDNIHLVALTGYGQETDRRRSREAGFDGHLVKPVDLEVLAKSLRN
jgi:signal transduction histidine kinase/DNA-binding response OmpR family regulator